MVQLKALVQAVVVDGIEAASGIVVVGLAQGGVVDVAQTADRVVFEAVDAAFSGIPIVTLGELTAAIVAVVNISTGFGLSASWTPIIITHCNDGCLHCSSTLFRCYH